MWWLLCVEGVGGEEQKLGYGAVINARGATVEGEEKGRKISTMPVSWEGEKKTATLYLYYALFLPIMVGLGVEGADRWRGSMQDPAKRKKARTLGDGLA